MEDYGKIFYALAKVGQDYSTSSVCPRPHCSAHIAPPTLVCRIRTLPSEATSLDLVQRV